MVPSFTFVALLLVSSAACIPRAHQNLSTRHLTARQDCPESGDQKLVGKLSFFDDENCEAFLSSTCVYALTVVTDGPPGSYGCGPARLPDQKDVFYGRVIDSSFPQAEFVLTSDQSCPPTGPGALLSVLKVDPTQRCIKISKGGSVPGLATYPKGNSGLGRLLSSGNLAQRAAPKCGNFVVEKEEPVNTAAKRVSDYSDCTNTATDQPCKITVSEENTQTWGVSFELSAGGGIEGIFSIEATFGTEYTESVTSSQSLDYSVEKGQKVDSLPSFELTNFVNNSGQGYVAGYTLATKFSGKYTDCDSGEKEQAGVVVVPKKGSIVYQLVYVSK